MENPEKNDDNKQEFKGRNLEDVISLAEHVLKVPRTKFSYEIVAEKTKLFGIKTKEIVIRAWPKTEKDKEPATRFLDDMLALYPLDIKYRTRRNHDIRFPYTYTQEWTLSLDPNHWILPRESLQDSVKGEFAEMRFSIHAGPDSTAQIHRSLLWKATRVNANRYENLRAWMQTCRAMARNSVRLRKNTHTRDH